MRRAASLSRKLADRANDFPNSIIEADLMMIFILLPSLKTKNILPWATGPVQGKASDPGSLNEKN